MDRDLTAKQAAQIAGCAASTMRKWLNQNLIEGSHKKEKGWIIPETKLKAFLLNDQSKAHANAIVKSRSAQINEIETVLRDQVKSLQEQLKDERERSKRLEADNYQLNAEIKAILGEKSGFNLKSVVSRWIRV